jgi:D-alanine-D-alanine ligase
MKARLRDAGLPVAPDLHEADPNGRFIVKSAIEHASFGIDDTSLVQGRAAAERLIAERAQTYGGIWFAEGYIHGREFDVSIVEDSEGVRLLPVSELDFYGPSLTGPRVFDYDTKWHPECAIAKGIEREFPERVEPLFSELERLATAAWDCFGLTGFAHADFRVDEEGRPFILEINANPCLGEEAGICRAAMEVGLSQVDIVAALLAAA